MAIGGRGARRIVVHGTAYHWRFRGRPTYCQDMAWSRCTFAVELAEDPGAVLVVSDSRPHPANCFQYDAMPVLPAEVADAIELALAAGWEPARPGRPFPLETDRGHTARSAQA